MGWIWHLRRRARNCTLRGDERGAVALLVALGIVPLALAVGLAVDGGRYLLARSRLAQAADAAALAAGARLSTTGFEDTAERMVRANFPQGYLGLELEDVRVAHDEASGRITLETRARMPTTFMRIARVDSVPVTSRTVVVRAAQPMEIALVLDVTGSMQCCGKLTGLKRAARDLVEIVFGQEQVSDLLRVAVVPFNARVNVGNHHRDWLLPSQRRVSPWRGCVESRPGVANALTDKPPANNAWFVPSEDVVAGGLHRGDSRSRQPVYDPPCPPALLPLTRTKRTVLDYIDRLSANGTTRIDMGARWGWRVLSRRWQGLWGEDPRHPNAADVVQAVIIMTDGDNETSVYDEVNDAQADANLLAICQSLKEAGYLIYAVTFQAPVWADTLMAQCATSPAHFFRSPTAADLQTAFRQIGSELSALRIAE
jgi:Flp pilus assembly protein TadG